MSTKLLLYIAWISIALGSINKAKASTTAHMHPQSVQSTTSSKAYNTMADNSSIYILGHCNTNEEFSGIGWEAPRFSCAIKISKNQTAQIKGLNLKAICLRMKNTTKTKNFKIWIKSNLESSSIIEQDINIPTPSEWCRFDLNTPYRISGEEFFIGYSFEMENIETTEEKLPIGVFTSSNPGSTYLYTDNYGWMDFSSRFGSLALQGIVELPTDFSTVDVALKNIAPFRMLNTSTKQLVVGFKNQGQETVENLEVSYTLGEMHRIITVPVIKPVPTGREGTFILPIQSPSQADETSITVQIEKVNGKLDPYVSNNNVQSNVTILSHLAQHKVLVEEGTGCWCQWCPRGAVGLKLIKERLNDKAIGIAIHASDALSSKDYENFAFKMQQNSGFPTALINRTMYADPYYGNSKENFGICELIDSLSSIPSIADIIVNGAVKADQDSFNLEVNSQTTFYSNIQSSTYTIVYAILENGLTGKQANGYAGMQNLPTELAYLSNLPSTIRNFPMNDVARKLYPNTEIFTPLPGKITDGNTISHTHVFKLEQNDFKNLENLEVVAILLNTNGTVENCNISPISINQTGVTQTFATKMPKIKTESGELHISDADNSELQVYSANGTLIFQRHINNNISIKLSGQSGMHIVRIFKDGKYFTSKITL